MNTKCDFRCKPHTDVNNSEFSRCRLLRVKPMRAKMLKMQRIQCHIKNYSYTSIPQYMTAILYTFSESMYASSSEHISGNM